jgi:hypothetical protein
MKRPSHFMLLFLVVVAAPLFIWGQQSPGTNSPAKKTSGNRLLNRGKGDFLPVTRQQPKQQGRETTAKPSGQASGLGTGLASGLGTGPGAVGSGMGPGLGGPWTVFGQVFREDVNGARHSSRPRVDLELVSIALGGQSGAALQSPVLNPSGEYSISGLQPGLYRLRAMPARESQDNLPIAVDFELPAPKAPDGQAKLKQDVVLPYPRTLFGTLETRAKAPRPGLTISVSETGMHRGTAVSDQTGGFAIHGVGHGPFDILVRDENGGNIPAKVAAPVRDSSDRSRVEVAVLVP